MKLLLKKEKDGDVIRKVLEGCKKDLLEIMIKVLLDVKKGLKIGEYDKVG